jgi:hypothetical protein
MRGARAYQRRHLLTAVQLAQSSPVMAPARAMVIASGTIIISLSPTLPQPITSASIASRR